MIIITQIRDQTNTENIKFHIMNSASGQFSLPWININIIWDIIRYEFRCVKMHQIWMKLSYRSTVNFSLCYLALFLSIFRHMLYTEHYLVTLQSRQTPTLSTTLMQELNRKLMYYTIWPLRLWVAQMTMILCMSTKWNSINFAFFSSLQ